MTEGERRPARRRLAEAATIWQVRAVQAEERLKQLTAGDEARAGAPQAAPEPQHEARPAEVEPMPRCHGGSSGTGGGERRTGR